MRKFVLKIGLYGILFLLILELTVRIFHLHNDKPSRFVDSDNINKWIPGQTGFAVHGNRVQNKAAYRINKLGFNSYREFDPSEESIEIALIGDSFIEGFHQNFDNSIGKKIEERINGIEIYEFGHSSNDFADQLYLVFQNKALFDKIDHFIFYLRYDEDLDRNTYQHITRKPLFLGLRSKSKLLEYSINIGMMDPLKDAMTSIQRIRQGNPIKKKRSDLAKETQLNKIDSLQVRIKNFDQLLEKYGFMVEKSSILLDSRKTPEPFIQHLQNSNIEIIDFAGPFDKAGGSSITTLIYDQHWNDTGREILADQISKFLIRRIITLD